MDEVRYALHHRARARGGGRAPGRATSIPALFTLASMQTTSRQCRNEARRATLIQRESVILQRRPAHDMC